MKKLFMITLGGKAKGAKIEVHDVQFIIAEEISETYSTLKDNWYGIELKLHLDAYKDIKGVDGYSVAISDKVENSDLKLYFVNIGAYDKSMMNEVHLYKLVVSNCIDNAKKKSLIGLPTNLLHIHVDNISDVEESNLLNKLYSGNVKLTPSKIEYNLEPDWFGYKRIDSI